MSETSESHRGDAKSSESSSQKFFGTEFIDRVAHRLDLSATFLLGFAAVLIAWGSYQSTLWGGVQDSLLTESVNTTTQATDRLQQADTIRSLDQVLFVELFSSGVCEEEGDGAICDQIFANMSADGVAAVEAWLTNDDLAPFGDDYDDALYTEGEALLGEADELFVLAGEANSNGDDYSMAITLFTVTLFFTGLSVTITASRYRTTMLLIGAGFLAVGAILMATLPWA